MNKEPIYHSNIFWHFCGRDKTEEEAFRILISVWTETLQSQIEQVKASGNS